MSGNFRQSIGDEDKRKLAAFGRALDVLFDERSSMPMQLVKSFLTAALHEGEGVTELAKRAGLSQSVMSRHLLDIGDRNRHMEEGFGWVTHQTDPMELRKHRVKLTNKGVALAHKVIRAMQSARE